MRNFQIILCILVASSCQNKPNALFQLKKNTGIDFNNIISENDSMNILSIEYFYRGGGVAIGDINNDLLPDIILGGNMVPSRLYLNKGNLQFEDITEASGLLNHKWINGISLVDINSDGLLDIYLCTGGSNIPEQRRNLCYIQQRSQNEIPIFKNKAAELGLDINKSTTQAAFFDYDLDGDLDAFLINTDANSKNPNIIRPKIADGSANNTDLLLENRLNETGFGKFVDVSKVAGILYDGFSLGVSVTDINMDGWPDIYIANDHLSNDILYINQKDKSFVNASSKAIKTQSYFSMGVFAKDIDNNGYNDILTLDMLPVVYERRQKMMMGMNLSRFQMAALFGYQPQFMKNTLQLNLGVDNNGKIHLNEMAQFAGVHATDWSWGSVIADFDLDGRNDIIITNGYARNITDMDFVSYQTNENFFKKEINNNEHRDAIAKQPAIALQNYAFKNTGQLQFKDVSNKWGVIGKNLSNGIAYGDLDLDGDLDVVINHINQKASIYENTAIDLKKSFIKVRTLDQKGVPVFGTKAFLYLNDSNTYYQELYPVQGYQSMQEPTFHFGLDKANNVDSLQLIWPNGNITKVFNLQVDTTYTFIQQDAENESFSYQDFKKTNTTFIKKDTTHFDWKHIPTNPYGDMEKQGLLQQTFSKETPPLAIADIDGNGLLDFFVGSGLEQKGVIYKQVNSKKFLKIEFEKGGKYEDTGATWLDADNDGDLDLYICSGNTLFWEGHESLQDRLYLQTDRGWILAEGHLPEMRTYTKSVLPLDFDSDGDDDLLVFGRIVTGLYPSIPRSYLLENENGKFVDRSEQYLPNVGIITDATKADINQDGIDEIIIAGEWQAIHFLRWEGNKFILTPIKASSKGWWHSIKIADINKDGYPDILCGNAGLNNDYASHLPLRLFATDIEGNGNPDPLLGWHITNSEGEKKLYPAFQRDDLMNQFSYMRSSFTKYADFASATMEDILKISKNPPEKYEITDMKSAILINERGNGFKKIPLPYTAQLGAITAFLTEDFNGDGLTDILCLGNSQNMHIARGWNSDFHAQLLLNSGSSFKAVPTVKTGVYINSEVRNAAILGANYFIISNYADSLKLYSW